MLEPKQIPKSAIPLALEKALRYRLLNEPLEAESICRDILEVEPDNQQALVTLLLALTDQFGEEFATVLHGAKNMVNRLHDEYEQAYYEGIIYERWGKAELSRHMPPYVAMSWFRKAMRCFERAETLRDPADPDAILRWNACVRFLERHKEDEDREPAAVGHEVDLAYDDEAPPRPPSGQPY